MIQTIPCTICGQMSISSRPGEDGWTRVNVTQTCDEHATWEVYYGPGLQKPEVSAQDQLCWNSYYGELHD